MTKPSKTIENTAVDVDGTNWQSRLAMQQAFLARLSGIRPTGRVVLEMTPEATTVADIPNFPLEDGDLFYIPFQLGTLQVAGIAGIVYNENAFRNQPRKHLTAYLNDAGGPTRQAYASSSPWSGRTEQLSAGKVTASSGIPTLKAPCFCPGTPSSSPTS
jgi:hypothetical protein